MAKIYLFDGSAESLNNWTNRDGSPINWIHEGDIMTVRHGDIISKETYGDAHIHVEWREPTTSSTVTTWILIGTGSPRWQPNRAQM